MSRDRIYGIDPVLAESCGFMSEEFDFIPSTILGTDSHHGIKHRSGRNAGEEES
jgi:hypothetical protein